MGRMLSYKGKATPKERKLIGHLANPEYICPGGRKWRHDDSESEKEDIVVPPQPDSDEEVISANSPTTGTSSSQMELRDEDDVILSAEATPSVPKRKAAGMSLRDIVNKGKASKRFKIVRRTDLNPSTVASTATPVPPPVVSQQQEPIMTTATTTTVTRDQSSSGEMSTSAQLQTVNSMLLNVLLKQKEQDDEIKRLTELMAKGEAERAEMSKKIDNQNLLLEEQKKLIENQNMALEAYKERIEVLEEATDTIQDSMVAGEDGVYRIKASADASAEPVDVDAERTDSDEEGKENQSESQYDITPISRKKSNLTYVLDMQGVIRFSVEHDAEEGEIIHCLSKEQIAELFQMNPDEVAPASTSEENSPDSEDDDDEIEFEQNANSTEPIYQSNDFREDADFDVNDDDLTRKLEKLPEATQATPNEEAIHAKKAEWVQAMKECFRPPRQVYQPDYTKFYTLKGAKTQGKIISWAYLDDLNVYAVKRERGIDYFQRAQDLKTLPYFDMLQLARLKLLYSEKDDKAAWLEKQLRYEFRNSWKYLRPQYPEITYSKERKSRRTGKAVKHIKYQAPKVMEQIPLRKMKTEIHRRFKWWYYDYRTTEAVIVMERKGNWETLRIFDPMWIRNLTDDDIYALYLQPIFFDIKDMDQAIRFNRVVRVCFLNKIHA